jgi:non-ribosomal peptide synthetase component F
VLSGHGHGEVAHEQVLEALEVEQRGAARPLFQVWFEMPDELDSIETDFASGASQVAGNGAAKMVDVALFVAESETELSAAFQYNSTLFAAETIEAMAEHYLNLLEQVAAGTTLGALDIPLDAGATDEAKAETISVSSETAEQFKFD